MSRVRRNSFRFAGGIKSLFPDYLDLAWYSKTRINQDIVDEVSGNNATLLVDPTVDIFDLTKWNIYDGGDGWNKVDFNTVDGVKTYKIIYNFTDFQKINDALSDNYILANDIDLSASSTLNPTTADEDFVVGKDYSASVFPTVVTYLGNRYIKTLYITGYVAGNIPDVTGIDINYWHIYNYEGFWVDTFKGIVNGNGYELQNCYVNKITDWAGVFSILSDNSIISNIRSTGISIGHSGYTGGLGGYLANGAIMDNCSSSCEVIGYENYTGGLLGWIRISNVYNSYATGKVTGLGYQIGGLAGGLFTGGSIENCYSTGLVTGYSTYIGGLLGRNYLTPLEIVNCFWDIETSGQVSSGGGTGKPTVEMQTQSTFTDADRKSVV